MNETNENEILFPEQVPVVRAETARDLRHLTGELQRVAHWSNPARLKEEGPTIIGLADRVREQLADVADMNKAAIQAVGVDLAIAKARGLLPIALAALLTATGCGAEVGSMTRPLWTDTPTMIACAPGTATAATRDALAHPGEIISFHALADARVAGDVTVEHLNSFGEVVASAGVAWNPVGWESYEITFETGRAPPSTVYTRLRISAAEVDTCDDDVAFYLHDAKFEVTR